MSIDFEHAYYIKLGRGGAWEEGSIQTDRLRIGWGQQSIEDINAGSWDKIQKQLQQFHHGKPVGVATTDLNALKLIAESTTDDVWITFHQSKMWWTRVADMPIQKDDISKFRATMQPWSDRTLDGRLLVVSDLPGKLSQLQGFRGTSCRVKYHDLLHRTLNGTRSDLATMICDQRSELASSLSKAIQELHWKDFETLVDMVFRHAGWIRVSVLGQHAKAYDLELREPILGDRYVVQVKSRATMSELENTIESFSPDDYRRVFFVVHSPDANLANASDLPDHIELIFADQLGELALDAGLVSWIEEKVA